MAEVLVEYSDLIADEKGRTYRARACGRPRSDHRWEGWIEFEPVKRGAPVRSPRETTQPNRADTHYWATGLTNVYLEGALHRALHPLTRHAEPPPPKPFFEGPAPEPVPAPPEGEAILNPFSIYRKGPTLLRRQLAALSSWHLVNIVAAYNIDTGRLEPNRMSPLELVDAIMEGARRHVEALVG